MKIFYLYVAATALCAVESLGSFLTIFPPRLNLLMPIMLSSLVISNIEVNEQTPISSNREYIYTAKNLLSEISRQVTTDSDIPSLYSDINFVLQTYSIRERLQNLVAEASYSNKICASHISSTISDELSILFNYFSVSNDTKIKLLIGDTFPGQKAEFIKMGLSAITSDLQKILFCGQ